MTLSYLLCHPLKKKTLQFYIGTPKENSLFQLNGSQTPLKTEVKEILFKFQSNEVVDISGLVVDMTKTKTYVI